MTRIKNLYWVTTPDGGENWFVIASSKKSASRFHELFEGYGKGSAKARLVCRVKNEYKKQKVYHAQLDMLQDLGFKIISYDPARVVRKDGIVYREGIVPHSIMFEVSDEKGAGLYIIRVSGNNKYKIGIANNFRQRFRNLQTGSADELEPVQFYPTPKYRQLEAYLHNKYRCNGLGREWFKFTQIEIEKLHDDIVRFICKNNQ